MNNCHVKRYILWSTLNYHIVHMILIKERLKHSSPRSNFICTPFQCLVNFKFLYFRKIQNLYSQIFIITSNLITIFKTVASIQTVLIQQRAVEKTVVQIEFVNFLHGCRAWSHFVFFFIMNIRYYFISFLVFCFQVLPEIVVNLCKFY